MLVSRPEAHASCKRTKSAREGPSVGQLLKIIIFMKSVSNVLSQVHESPRKEPSWQYDGQAPRPITILDNYHILIGETYLKTRRASSR
jgi:hypothetical protein